MRSRCGGRGCGGGIRGPWEGNGEGADVLFVEGREEELGGLGLGSKSDFHYEYGYCKSRTCGTEQALSRTKWCCLEGSLSSSAKLLSRADAAARNGVGNRGGISAHFHRHRILVWYSAAEKELSYFYYFLWNLRLLSSFHNREIYKMSTPNPALRREVISIYKGTQLPILQSLRLA